MTILYFQRSERINLFHYNINIACKHSNGLIQAKWLILMRNKGLKIGLRLTDYQPFFWGRLTGFVNNRNTTALLSTDTF